MWPLRVNGPLNPIVAEIKCRTKTVASFDSFIPSHIPQIHHKPRRIKQHKSTIQNPTKNPHQKRKEASKLKLQTQTIIFAPNMTAAWNLILQHCDFRFCFLKLPLENVVSQAKWAVFDKRIANPAIREYFSRVSSSRPPCWFDRDAKWRRLDAKWRRRA